MRETTNTTAILTIVSNNYLHFARTLLQSVAQFQPDADRFCFIVDKDMQHAQDLCLEFEPVNLLQLELPDGLDFLFQYTILELNTAVKPWAIEHLLNHGYRKVIYLDPDICLFRPLMEVQELLDHDADIVMTPHLLAPLNDDYRPTELDIRCAGTYNLGFCAVRESDNTRDYLHWWQKKLRYECIVNFERGIFVDQSWMDLVPGLFERVAVLRHQGYNVAYWNLAQRRLVHEVESGGLLVNGDPLVFFHFSGLNPIHPEKVSKHQNRFTFSNLPEAVRTLFESYVAEVNNNGLSKFSGIPYGFGCYDDHSPITDAERARFRQDPELRRQCHGRPFSQPQSLRLPLASAEESEAPLSVAPGNIRRLQKVFLNLLGRMPERSALVAMGPRLDSPAGMVRTVLAVGLSREARLTPGWAIRLLLFTNQLHLIPRSLKQWVVSPLLRLLQAAGQCWPRLAYRSPGGHLLHSTISTPESTPEMIRPVRTAPARPISQLSCPPGINLIGYLRAELGVGEAARSLARACIHAKIPYSVTDVGYQSQNLQRDTSIITSSSDCHYPIDLLYVNADQAVLTSEQLQAKREQNPLYVIGFWHWEQPILPSELLGAFNHVDEVWVPSTFVQDAIADVAPVPTFKIPHALEFAPSPKAQRKEFGLPEGRMLILMMYDFHSYQHRKNPQAAIAAFRIAVRRQSNLGLVIKTINGEHYSEALAELRESVADLQQIFFIDEFLTRQQTWDLQECCDVLLSLHRAEGFGLAPAEMMYLGKPVIATGWSANMDFMTPANSFPVRFHLQPLKQDLGAYPSGPLWAEADVEHAAWCIEQLAAFPELADKLGRQAMTDIREQLSPAVVGRQIRQRLQILGHWYPKLLQEDVAK